MDGSLSSPKPTSSNNRQETISKNLKDEFNGDDEPSNDSVVIKEELGRMSTPRGMAREDGEDGFEEDPDASLIGGGGGGGVGGGGGGGWGELSLAGPSGLQQNPDANQPAGMLFGSVRHPNAEESFQRQRANLSSLFQAPEPLPDIKCPFCQKLFAHKSSMCRHKMMCKKNNKPKEKLSCGFCFKTFSQKWMLQKHIAESDCVFQGLETALKRP